MLPRTLNSVALRNNADEFGLSMRNEGCCAEECVVKDGFQALRIMSAETVMSSFTSDASSTLTEQMELETGMDQESVAGSPASGIAESGTGETQVDYGVGLGQEVSETLRLRQDRFLELLVDSGLESPKAAGIVKKTCGQDWTPKDRVLPTILTVLSDKENASSTLTEHMELETGMDHEYIAGSPASGMVESPTVETQVDSGVGLDQEASEKLRVRQDSFLELLVDSGLESPEAAGVVEKTCGQDWTPNDRMLPTTLTVFSEKENPGSARVGTDMNTYESITRAPMKPARMSFLNQTVKSSSVRRRLNFDG